MYGESPAKISAMMKRELEFKLDIKMSHDDMVKIANESSNSITGLTYAERTQKIALNIYGGISGRHKSV